MCIREPGSCPQTGYLNWIGTARAKKQGHPAISYEDEGSIQDKPGVSDLQLDRPPSSGQVSSSLVSSIASDEEEVFQNGSRVKRKVVSEVLRKYDVCVCARACGCMCV
jgi:hypothetical protein